MSSFDSLKREAVQLERQLEDKVLRYQQIAQRVNQHAMKDIEEGSLSLDEEEVIANDINRIMKTLQELISQKLPHAARSPAQNAIVHRYRDILSDQRKDFEKAQLNVRRAQQRSELFGNASSSTAHQDPAMESLLRERHHIQNSMNAADNIIGQADAIRSDLRFQGSSLRNAGSLLTSMTTNIPGLNNLIEQIRRKRSRDDKIVAGVIAMCIFFTVWYIFH